jgi:hypothetical protein
MGRASTDEHMECRTQVYVPTHMEAHSRMHSSKSSYHHVVHLCTPHQIIKVGPPGRCMKLIVCWCMCMRSASLVGSMDWWRMVRAVVTLSGDNANCRCQCNSA